VVAGMLMYQVRTNQTNCSDSKFNQIQQTCTGPTTVKAYGVDPVFKTGVTLYNPDYANVGNTIVTQFYNCTLLQNATYNITILNQTTNPYPYCAELFSPEELPYAFFYFPLENKVKLSQVEEATLFRLELSKILSSIIRTAVNMIFCHSLVRMMGFLFILISTWEHLMLPTG
jgi:hypothetical protein